MSKNIIRDGYTRTGYIAAVERLHDELRFEYRPMLPEQVETLQDATEKKTPSEGIRLVAAALAKQITSWSETAGEDANATPVPINFEHVRRLHFSVINKLYRIVAGISPSDPVPEAKEAEQDEYVASLLASATEGRAIGVIEAEKAEKN